MTAIAVDDEWLALDILDRFCLRLAGIQLAKTFTDPAQARLYVESHPVDLVFLDINMPAESGLYFIRSLDPAPLVIFTTAYSEYAVESYDLQAVDYLLKPFTFERFSQAVQQAKERMIAKRLATHQVSIDSDPAHVFFRLDYGFVKVVLGDILFIEGLENYLKLYLRGNKQLVIRLTFRALLKMLPTDEFIRVHRSYVVARNKIDAVRSREIQIGENFIPVGNKYAKDLSTWLAL